MMKVLMLAAVSLLLTVSGAVAERRAVLVGVSDYDAESVHDLQGPRNDVQVMRDALAEMGFDRIAVLSDGASFAGIRPTKGNIMSTLEGILVDPSLKRGDQVLVYFSGHGSRQADLNGDEPDGADEVFLPADFSIVNATTDKPGYFKDALVDDEIGDYLDKLRNLGVNAWLVMDSCHSASGARGESDAAIGRYVPPESVGVTPTSPKISLIETYQSSQLHEDAGTLVAFYGSQAYEQGFEQKFGVNADGSAQVYGRFTAAFTNRLKGAGNLTYRQLFDAVLDDMAGYSQTPFVEGNALDSGIGSPSSVRQYRVKSSQGLTVEAGQLQGLGKGSILALYADAASSPDERIGYAQVESADARTAMLRPVADDCVSTASVDLCPAATGGRSGDAKYARLSAASTSLSLSIAPPLLLGGDEASYASLYGSLLAGVEATKDLGVTVQLEASNPDVLVAFKDGQMWFAWPEGFAAGPRPSGVSWPATGTPGVSDVAQLGLMLQQIGKATNLVKLANALRSTPTDKPLLTVSGVRKASVSSALRTVDDVTNDLQYDPADECKSVDHEDANALESFSIVKQCDVVSLTVQVEAARRSVDVNAIYIDANFGIGVEYYRIDPPLVEAVNQKRELQVVNQFICSDCPAPNGHGVEAIDGPEMVIIVSAATSKGSAPFDLRSLEMESLSTANAKGAESSAVANALVGLAMGSTRGRIAVVSQGSDLEVDMYRWRVIPRSDAIAESFAVDEATAAFDKGVHPEGALSIFLRLQKVAAPTPPQPSK